MALQETGDGATGVRATGAEVEKVRELRAAGNERDARETSGDEGCLADPNRLPVSQEHRDKMIAVAALLKGVSHPVRLCILSQLAEHGESDVTSLINCMGVSQSSVSQHLAKMRDLRIVTARKEGKRVYYRIESPYVVDLLLYLFFNESSNYNLL